LQTIIEISAWLRDKVCCFLQSESDSR
jgi:hypothetical protein